MIISFSGLDGSGKTTNAIFVQKYLSKHRLKSVQIPLLHRSLFWKTGQLLKKKQKKQYAKIKDKEFDTQDKGLLKKSIGLVRKITYLIDLFSFSIWSYNQKRKKKIIICDRYFYDLAVQSQYMGLFGKLFTAFYNIFIPHPHIAFFLRIRS